jgi:hypothetical protein
MEELLLNSEVNVGFIAETEDILEVAEYLMEDGITLYYDSEKEIDEIIDNNEILQITKIVCEDCGEETYFIEEVFDEYGYTIPDDELVFTYVDEDLLDCIEYTALDTDIVPVEIEYEDEEPECNGDCDNCMLHEDTDDEDYEKEIEEEDLGYTLTDELLSSLSEINPDDVESIVNMIADKLNEAFAIGYNEALEDSKDELKDSIEAIKSLRLDC